jgi:hypothetical protein
MEESDKKSQQKVGDDDGGCGLKRGREHKVIFRVVGERHSNDKLR